MADSDSDDELMSRLTRSMGLGAVDLGGENCAYCATPNATLACSICDEAFYCSEACKRRHARAHRAFCIRTRMERQASERSESESSSDESESESEDVAHSPLPGLRPGSRSGSGSGSGFDGGIQVPGLSQKQITRLLELSSQAESLTSNKAIDKLQQQIAQLMSSRESEQKNGASSREVGGASLKEIKELHKKLQELEKKTQTVTFAPQVGGMAVARSVYTPLLVKDDPDLRKYFKLKDMEMPEEQIKAKMKADDVDPELLDMPDSVSPNDPGPKKGAYIPMSVADDPVFKKYFKLKAMDMPENQIKLKMEADGVDPELLDNPAKASPNDPGPPLQISTGYPDPAWSKSGASPVMSSPGSSQGFSWPNSLVAGAMGAAAVAPYEPLLVKNDPELKKYFKLRQMGMPDDQIKLKMKAEDVDPALLDCPDDMSPNDPGPPVPASGGGSSSGPPVSMEQLFSILMQHQQIIQQVSNGGVSSSQRGRSSFSGANGTADPAQPLSVEDQMAQELAAAESAIDDIFGDESQQAKGPGGMSMIEQLEKKARKDSNKKLVEHREEVNRLIAELLSRPLASDEEAMAFYREMYPKLESLGLALGVDSVQKWSSRLLIKNKETRDWYFSEQERLDAGKAYARLWGLSFLDRDAGQLMAKRSQIVNAPATLHAVTKGKPELIDKFTQLLKETVKLKHKIFKSGTYTAEVRQLQELGIPECFEQRGTELVDATTVLADAAMGLAEEEFRLLERATRAKKIRALTVVHVADKAVKLVGIVQKIGARGVNVERLRDVETGLAKVKDTYLSGEQEEEEEEDVL